MSVIINFLSRELAIGEWSISISDIIIAIVLIVVGILLGKIIKGILKKIAEKAEINRTVKQSFIDLFLVVIEFSIYLLFLNLTLNQLNIPQLISWISNILIIIPALVGALILIAVGFVIASYLKDVVEESKVINWEILSKIVFYFVNYVFLVFALKTALISIDNTTVNILLVLLTAIIAAAYSYRFAKKKA